MNNSIGKQTEVKEVKKAPETENPLIKNKGGRPTKFKEEFINQLITFFDIAHYEKHLTEVSKEWFKDGTKKKEVEKFRVMPNKLPTLYSFARGIEVDYTSIYRWAHKTEKPLELEDRKILTLEQIVIIDDYNRNVRRFCNAYKEAKILQKEFLIGIGLSGAAPSPFAIFVAKNLTDMRDKTETDITTKGQPIPLLHALRNNDSTKENIPAPKKD